MAVQSCPRPSAGEMASLALAYPHTSVFCGHTMCRFSVLSDVTQKPAFCFDRRQMMDCIPLRCAACWCACQLLTSKPDSCQKAMACPQCLRHFHSWKAPSLVCSVSLLPACHCKSDGSLHHFAFCSLLTWNTSSSLPLWRCWAC